MCFNLSLVTILVCCSAAVAQNAPVSGKWQREFWNGIAGSNVSNLTESPFFYQGSSSTGLVDSSYSLLGDNYGARTRGYITPTTTGIYTFWVAGAHETQWFVSPNTSKWDARKLSGILSATQENNWDQNYAQRSAPQFMKAGQSYYVELLQKVGTGGGHASVAWAMQGVDSSSVQNWASPSNGAVATQFSSLSNSYPASNLIDGNTETFNHTGNTAGSSVQVDLGRNRIVERVEMINRGSFQNRLSNFRATVEDVNGAVLAAQDFYPSEGAVGLTETWTLVQPVVGRRVKIQLLGPNRDNNHYLHLGELRAFGSDTTAKNWAQESSAVATQSSSFSSSCPASNLIDGKIQTVNHTDNTAGSSVQVDLGQDRIVDSVELINRDSFQNRLSNFRVSILNSADAVLASQDYYLTSGNVQGALRWQLPEAVIGRKVKVQLLGLNRNNNHYLHLAELNVWGRTSSNESERGLRTLVSPDVMSSYEPTLTDDADDNGYKDTWQNAYGFPAGYQVGDRSPFADPDGDLRNNLREALENTNPFVGDGKPGLLTRFSYNNMPYYSLGETRKKHRYFGAPDLNTYHTSSLITGMPNYSAGRIRGAVTPPQTGYYRFWIANTESAELWLSTVSGSRFHKQRLCAMSTELGSGHGVASNSLTLWDSFVSQMSDEIYLEAGKPYYLEADYQFGHAGGPHISIAWAKRGGPRAAIPAEALSSYFPSPDDLDDDMLPDSWEQSYGLSIADAGNLDIERQGEFGDYDQDGLSNREEFIHGSDPSNSDTDSDGVSDFTEVNLYKTSPTQSDVIPSEVLSVVDVVGDLLDRGLWQISGSRLVSESYRNHASWKLEVPEAGMFQVELGLKMTVAKVREATTFILAGVDGIPVGRYEIRFGTGNQARIFIDLPFLEAGTHELSLDLAGLRAIGNLSLESLVLKRPHGSDLNGDGIADEHFNELKKRSHLTELPGSSFFSPYVLEGISPSLQAVSLEANGEAIAPQGGVGNTGWKAEIGLGEAPVELTVGFEKGGWRERRTLTWLPLDLSESHTLQAREGDFLKFSIPTSLGAWVEVTPPRGLAARVALVSTIGKWQFTTPGTYTLHWMDHGGMRSKSLIHVHPRSFGADLGSALQGRIRELSTRHDTRSLSLDGGGAFQVLKRKPLTNAEKLTVAICESGGARLGFRDAGSGRLLGLLPIDVIDVSDALTSLDYASFESGNSDTLGTIYRMAFSDLSPGWTVEVSIFKAGVTFRDGTLSHIFTQADLVNGILSLELLRPKTLSSGLCHRFIIRDASGRVVR